MTKSLLEATLNLSGYWSRIQRTNSVNMCDSRAGETCPSPTAIVISGLVAPGVERGTMMTDAAWRAMRQGWLTPLRL